MRKEKICKSCSKVKLTWKVCDVCGDRLRDYSICEIGKKILDVMGNPIELFIEGTTYDFCSMKHLLEFVIDENNKLNPRTDIIEGGLDGN